MVNMAAGMSTMGLIPFWPAHLVFHKGYALALDGVGQNGLGLAGLGGLVQRGEDRLQIIAVGQLNGVEPESSQFIGPHRQGQGRILYGKPGGLARQGAQRRAASAGTERTGGLKS